MIPTEPTFECAGCGVPTDHSACIGDARISICADCEHDATVICHVCPSRIWIADGYRMQDGTIECRDCAALDPRHVAGRMRELIRDEQKHSDESFLRR